MTDTDRRVAGRRGVRESHQPRVALHLFRTTAPAPPPPTGDVTGGLTDWGMDDNDRWSCCGPAATDHNIVAKAGGDPAFIGKLGGVGPLPLYFAYGAAMGEPGDQPDAGVDNASWLQFLFDRGIIDAFAEVVDLSPDSLHRAMLDFAGVIVALRLPHDAEAQFAAGEPWTLDENPDPNEGHDVLLVAYSPYGDEFVTWEKLQAATIPWDASCITDAWVIVTAEDAKRASVDMAALSAECRRLRDDAAPAAPERTRAKGRKADRPAKPSKPEPAVAETRSAADPPLVPADYPVVPGTGDPRMAKGAAADTDEEGRPTGVPWGGA